MLRNIKALGLAFVAALAMSAVGAAGAQAEKPAHFEPGHIDLTNAGEGEHTWVIGSLHITCATARGTGALSTISAEFTASTVIYETCHFVSLGITFNVTIDMNGCDYKFTAGTWTHGPSKSDGSMHIECPAGKVIQFTVKKLNGEPKCEFDIGPQTPTSGNVTFNNGTTESKMSVTAHMENVVVHATQTTIAAHDALCTNHATLNSTYNGSLWMKETSPPNTYVDTTVTGVA